MSRRPRRDSDVNGTRYRALQAILQVIQVGSIFMAVACVFIAYALRGNLIGCAAFLCGGLGQLVVAFATVNIVEVLLDIEHHLRFIATKD